MVSLDSKSSASGKSRRLRTGHDSTRASSPATHVAVKIEPGTEPALDDIPARSSKSVRDNNEVLELTSSSDNDDSTQSESVTAPVMKQNLAVKRKVEDSDEDMEDQSSTISEDEELPKTIMKPASKASNNNANKQCDPVQDASQVANIQTSATRQTRASNGILHISPSKKKRIATKKTIPELLDDHSAPEDVPSMSPLKLDHHSKPVTENSRNSQALGSPMEYIPTSKDKGKKKRANIFSTRRVTNDIYSDDESLRKEYNANMAKAIEESRKAVQSANHTDSSSKIDTGYAQDIRYHPDELAAIEKAMEDSRPKDDTGAPQDVDTTDITSTPANTDDVPKPRKKVRADIKQRRTFRDVVPDVTTAPVLGLGSNGKLLQDTMIFRVTSLPKVCEVTQTEMQDPLLAEFYKNLPNLRYGVLKGWSSPNSSNSGPLKVWFSGWTRQCPKLCYDDALMAINFDQYKNFLNPSRASPLGGITCYYPGDDRKRGLAQIDSKPAIFISCILSADSFLLEATTSGLKNKYLSGNFHHQEWQRFEAFACMIFNKPTMTAQITGKEGSISFMTIGNRDNASPSKPPRNPGILSGDPTIGKKPKTPKADTHFKSVLDYTDIVPVYDGRDFDFNFASDFNNIAAVLPLYRHEIPRHSFVVVAYTMGFYEKEGRANLSTNILFTILLATEDD